VKRQWGCREGQFSAFSMAVFSDTLEMRSALLYGKYAVRRRLFSDPKCTTLNDLEWVFRVKFCFRADLAG